MAWHGHANEPSDNAAYQRQNTPPGRVEQGCASWRRWRAPSQKRLVLVVVRNTWGEAMGLAMEGRSEFGMDDPRRRAGTLAQARAIALLERKQAEAARR